MLALFALFLTSLSPQADEALQADLAELYRIQSEGDSVPPRKGAILKRIAPRVQAIEPSVFGMPKKYAQLRLNQAGKKFDVIRFKTPAMPLSWDMEWDFAMSSESLASWFIVGPDIPLDGFKNYNSSDDYQDPESGLPKKTFRVLQKLEGAQLQPDQTYLLWFMLETESPADLYVRMHLTPSSLPAYQQLKVRGLQKLLAGDHEGALADLNKGIEVCDDKAWVTELTFARGRVRYAKGAYGEAIADFSETLKFAPDVPVILQYRARAHYDGGTRSEALADFRKHIAVDAENSDYSRLFVFLIRARFDERDAARKELTQFLEARKTRGDWYGKLAQFLTGTVSADDLLKAAEEKSDEPVEGRRCEAHFYVGTMKLIDGDKTGARTNFKKCLETGVNSYIEYDSAVAELRRLGDQPKADSPPPNGDERAQRERDIAGLTIQSRRLAREIKAARVGETPEQKEQTLEMEAQLATQLRKLADLQATYRKFYGRDFDPENETAVPVDIPALERDAQTTCQRGLALIQKCGVAMGRQLNPSEAIELKGELNQGLKLLVDGLSAYDKANATSGKTYDTRTYVEAMKAARLWLRQLEGTKE